MIESPIEGAFDEIVALIRAARQQAARAVNTELIELYWRIGDYLHRKIESDGWAKGTVVELAAYIAQREPGLRGFSPQNLWRMRQFFVTYRNDPKLSPLVRVLPWTHNLFVLGQSKRREERAFYLSMAVQERWSKRELERQFRLAAFERAVLRPTKVSAVVTRTHGEAAASVFKDAYVVDFLNLPDEHTEADLHRGLLARLKAFLIELGRDFCFVGSEYPMQVGGRDFALDLLFFHRGLNCLVAIELKVDRFEPEYLGKLGFYLEALDRDARKPHALPRADRRVPDPTARQDTARGQAARVLRPERARGGDVRACAEVSEAEEVDVEEELEEMNIWRAWPCRQSDRHFDLEVGDPRQTIPHPLRTSPLRGACTVILIVPVVLALAAGAQAPALELVPTHSVPASWGTTFKGKIHSASLGEDRTVDRFLPASFDQTTRKFPIIFLTDGEHYFERAVTAARELAASGHIPECIVAAVLGG